MMNRTKNTGTALATFLLFSTTAMGQHVRKIDVPVMINADAEDACSNGEIVGLDPKGDGFLSVRSGPGGPPYSEIDHLFNGSQVYICGHQGSWYSVVYTSARGIGHECGVSTPWSTRQAYTGPCRSGWVHSHYVHVTAG
jgi:uncharacterized protein YraI